MHNDLNPSPSLCNNVLAELLHLVVDQRCTVNSFSSIVTGFGDILYTCIIFTSMSIILWKYTEPAAVHYSLLLNIMVTHDACRKITGSC